VTAAGRTGSDDVRCSRYSSAMRGAGNARLTQRYAHGNANDIPQTPAPAPRQSRSRFTTEDAKLDGRLDIEEMHPLRLESVEHSGGFFRCNRDQHFNRLVGKLKKMR